jgi:hypothetical protein
VRKSAAQPLAWTDHGSHPIALPDTLLTNLPANNPWRIHHQAPRDMIHSGMEDVQTNIAQVTNAPHLSLIFMPTTAQQPDKVSITTVLHMALLDVYEANSGYPLPQDPHLCTRAL